MSCDGQRLYIRWAGKEYQRCCVSVHGARGDVWDGVEVGGVAQDVWAVGGVCKSRFRLEEVMFGCLETCQLTVSEKRWKGGMRVWRVRCVVCRR
jgi:hypothetical protein